MTDLHVLTLDPKSGPAPTATVVAIHGLGASADDLVGLAEALALPGVRWVFPQGWMPVVHAFGQGWAWFEMPPRHEPGIRESRRRLHGSPGRIRPGCPRGATLASTAARERPRSGPGPRRPRCACSPETAPGATRAPAKRPPPASGHGHDQHSTGPGPDGRREPEAPRAGGTGRRQREGPVLPWTDSARHDEGSTLDAGPGCSPRIDPRRRRPGGRRWRVAACPAPRGRGRRNLGGRRGDATPRSGLGRPPRVTVDQAVAFSTRRRRGVMATLSTER